MDDLDRAYERIVNESWGILAAFGWQQFSEFGRGAIVIFISELEDLRGLKIAKYTYLSQKNDAARFSGDVAQLLTSYDPESEIVIVFDEGSGNIDRAYVCGADVGPVPPDAFRLYGEQLDHMI